MKQEDNDQYDLTELENDEVIRKLLNISMTRMPVVDQTFKVNFKNDVKTFFNNSLQSRDELVEIKQEFLT